MNKYLSRQNIPFLFLIAISLSWSYYYLTSNFLNDLGAVKDEWMLLVDGLIVLPVICFYCFRDNIKLASLKAAAYASLIILLGSFIIPQQQKHIWLYLEDLRYVALAVFLILEITSIFTVILMIKTALSGNSDPDNAIEESIKKLFSNSALASLMIFEARIWTYALFPSKIRKEQFIGNKHFSCHLKDGTQSNLLGFIILIAVELPIVHMLLHFTWSATGAIYVSIATAIGLIFFIAEYRAISLRPISLTEEGIIIRYSVWNPLFIPFEEIKSVTSNSKFIKRSKNTKRYNLSGNPNVKITLRKNSNSQQLMGIDYLYLGLDSPQQFIENFRQINSFVQP